MQVFLAFSFRDEDRDLVAQVERLFESHDVRLVTGETLGGQALTPEIKKRIEAADGLVALLTRRDALADGNRFTTHPWVDDEHGHARQVGTPAIALIETGVETGGMYGEDEYIAYDRAAPLDAFLALSATLGVWKRQRGRLLKVQIQPQDLAHDLAFRDNGVVCAYRCARAGQRTDWADAPLLDEGLGVYAYLSIPDDSLIQLRVEKDGEVWLSKFNPQWMKFELQRSGGGA